MDYPIVVIRYQNQYREIWNQFVAQAENATFLFDRNFMDYHADRFQDHSLMLFIDNELLAVFPANEKPPTIHAHQGLTYSSLVFKSMSKFDLKTYATYFLAILEYYQQKGMQTLIYKEIPIFYQSIDFEKKGMIQAMINDNLLTIPPTLPYQIDTGAVIDLQDNFQFSHGRNAAIKKARLNSSLLFRGFENQPTELEIFWNQLLIPNLKSKYGLSPTHTVEEIILLASRFPENIKFFSIYYQNQMVAGTLLFLNKQVAHCQYIASSAIGKKLNATDLLFHFLICETYKNFDYFSFGISNWQGTNKINEGLRAWKQSWGARPCMHTHYRIELGNM